MDHFTEYGSDSDSSPDVSASVQSSAPSTSGLSGESVTSVPGTTSNTGSEGSANSSAVASTPVADENAAAVEAGDATALANPEVQEKIKRFLDSMSTENGNANAQTFTEKLKQQKEFRNPYWLAKVIGHFGINDAGSNYPVEKFDPSSYPEKYFKENLPFLRTDAPIQGNGATTAVRPPSGSATSDSASGGGPPQTTDPLLKKPRLEAN